jgi:hypothetical protein
MALKEAMLPEFDHEMANTRKSLERVPEDIFDWKPHAKPMTLRHLPVHLASPSRLDPGSLEKGLLGHRTAGSRAESAYRR